MKLCSNCGKECEENDSICPSCSNPLEETIDAGTQQPDSTLPEQAQPNTIVQTPQQPLASHTPTNSSGAKFAQKYLGFVGLGVLLLFTVLLVILASLKSFGFLSPMDITNLFNQFLFFGIIALGTVAATRIKGPDLSIGHTMALAGIIVAMNADEGNLYFVIISAILICCICGLLNGILISFFNIPAVILTLITASLIHNVMFILTEVQPIAIGAKIAISLNQHIPAFFISVLIALAALLITNRLPVLKIGKNSNFLQKVKDALGYVLVAVIAGTAGILMVARSGGVTANKGIGYEPFIIIVFAAVQSSRLLKNNIAALVYGLAVTLMFITTRTALMFLWVDMSMLYVIEAAMTFFMLCITCVAQGGWRSMLSSNLSECTEKDAD